jgi:fructokinase
MRIGIDLGSSKIEGVVLAADGSERVRLRVPTPAGDYAATIAAVVDLVGELERSAGGPASVGVGIPGAVSPATGRIKNANATWTIGRSLDKDLERALGRPVRLDNDANCFAASEAADGAGAGADVVFGVILGSGVGGGIVVNGRLLTGINRVAGEWGHNPLPWMGADEWPGPLCYCGKRGCIETFVAGPAFAREFREATGRALAAAEIVRLAAAGDAAAGQALHRYADRLARALASVINVLDPDVIVLGGGMSNIEELYRWVPERWQQWVFSDRTDTRLAANRHGDASGVRGAARLWPPETPSWPL